jgi:hypothetical protein
MVSRAALAGKTQEDFGVNAARSGRTADPVVDRGRVRVELDGKRFHAVRLDEAGELGFPASRDYSVDRRTPLLVVASCCFIKPATKSE